MPYHILTAPDSPQVVIQHSIDRDNRLVLTDHRDLRSLFLRVEHYLTFLDADGVLPQAIPQENEMINTSEAQQAASEKGRHFEGPALRFALTRGNIPGAEKRGGRWFLPRKAFEVWLAKYLSRKERER